MSKIVFISPPLTSEEMYGKLALGGSNEALLGICYLAAVVRDNNLNVEIIDMPALNLGYEEVVNMLIKRNPRYIGFTSVTLAIYNAAKLAEMIKEKIPNVIILIGGAHITATPKETMSKFHQFDIGVIGEGETVIVDLLNALENDLPLQGVRGIIFRDNNKIIDTGPATLIKDLDELPMPAWDLLPDISKNYTPTLYAVRRSPSFSLITSRGCAFQCTFCDRSVFGNKYRMHSPEYIIAMIKDLYFSHGIRDIRFNDDEFMLSKKRTKKLCEYIVGEKLDFSWSCLARVSSIDADILRIMKKAGCWQIRFGIESGSQMVLDTINKGITLEQVERAVSLTKQEGIKSIGFFMMGLPKETIQTIRETIDFAKKLKLDDFKINYFAPLPGSQLYSDLSKYGKANLDWRELHFHVKPSFIPYGLTEGDLIKLNKLAFKEFYLRPRIILSYPFKTKYFLRNIKALVKGGTALINHYYRK